MPDNHMEYLPGLELANSLHYEHQSQLNSFRGIGHAMAMSQNRKIKEKFVSKLVLPEIEHGIQRPQCKPHTGHRGRQMQMLINIYLFKLHNIQMKIRFSQTP